MTWSPARAGAVFGNITPHTVPELRELLTMRSHLESSALDALADLRDDGEGLPSWLHDIEDCALWTMTADQRAARWTELGWMQRDPARWVAATDADRLDRWVKDCAFEFHSYDLCDLGRPDSRRAFAEDNSGYGIVCFSEYYQPGQAWELAQADRCLGDLDAAALLGDSAAVLAAARQVRCLQDSYSDVTGVGRGVLRARIQQDFVRRVEACLPLIDAHAKEHLLDVLTAMPDPDWRLEFERMVRAERAGTYYAYLDFADLAETRPEKWGSVNVHEQFLDCLDVYDRLLDVIRASDYAALRAGLKPLQHVDLDGPLGRWLHEDFETRPDDVRLLAQSEALRRCSLVGASALVHGVETARALAAVTLDPFTDDPLRTRLRDDGVFEVWSVGSDLTDDGGSTASAPGEPDRDVVFRVPLD